MSDNGNGWVRRTRRIDQLRIGDRVLTPARRWETVIALRIGERFSRRIQVVTDATGPEVPWSWVDRHTVPTMRRLPALPTVVAA